MGFILMIKIYLEMDMENMEKILVDIIVEIIYLILMIIFIREITNF